MNRLRYLVLRIAASTREVADIPLSDIHFVNRLGSLALRIAPSTTEVTDIFVGHKLYLSEEVAERGHLTEYFVVHHISEVLINTDNFLVQ